MSWRKNVMRQPINHYAFAIMHYSLNLTNLRP